MVIAVGKCGFVEAVKYLKDTIESWICSKLTAASSQQATLLEYRILQIKYKIVLQEICLHSAYLSDKDKNKYDEQYEKIKGLLSTFPVYKTGDGS